MADDKNLLVKMVLDLWHGRIKQTDRLLAELSDEQLMQEVAPGKNRGLYLLGHLTAVHDQLFPLLDLGEAIFPTYKPIFIDNPDQAIAELPTIYEIKQSWANVNIQLSKAFGLILLNEWFQRHTAVSAEDFAKEPHRNKLNIVLSRSSHLGYHLGQLILLKR